MIEQRPPSVVIVDNDADHILTERLIVAQLVPNAVVEVMTDPRTLAQRPVAVPQESLVLIDRNLDGRDSIDLMMPPSAERPDLRTVLLSVAWSGVGAGAHTAVEKPFPVSGWRELVGPLLVTEPMARPAGAASPERRGISARSPYTFLYARACSSAA
jgi:hypothetical protein